MADPFNITVNMKVYWNGHSSTLETLLNGLESVITNVQTHLMLYNMPILLNYSYGL
jgi:hypothetical protein